MNIIQLEYFLALAKYENFRKTAQALYVSQPAVSKQIANLERELGVTLFSRDYRMVTLTPAGRVLHRALSKGQSIFSEALRQAKLLDAKRPSSLSLGVMENAELGNLYEIVQEFQKERNDISLRVERVPIADLALHKLGGSYDMVIIHERSLQNISGLQTRILTAGSHVGLLSQDHTLCKKEKLAFRDLQSESFYVPARKSDSITVDYCTYICAMSGFTPPEIVTLPNVESVLLAVKMGFGAAVLDSLIYIPPSYRIRSVDAEMPFNVMLAWDDENTDPAVQLLAERICRDLKMPAQGK